MIVDGKQIAEEIKQELKEKVEGKKLVLGVVVVGDDMATVKFVEQKKKFGEAIGVEVKVFEYGVEISEEELGEQVQNMALNKDISGIVVQLPLSKTINASKILNLIPANKDVDALSENASVLSPVVGAVKEILEKYRVDLTGKKILVIGRGKLVGAPVAIWLTQEGYEVETADIKTKNLSGLTKNADVIISGAGKPGLIKPETIKQNAIVIDAGAPIGDADPACAEHCSLFTPVPGGVGPITVAILFRNMLELTG